MIKEVNALTRKKKKQSKRGYCWFSLLQSIKYKHKEGHDQAIQLNDIKNRKINTNKDNPQYIRRRGQNTHCRSQTLIVTTEITSLSSYYMANKKTSIKVHP